MIFAVLEVIRVRRRHPPDLLLRRHRLIVLLRGHLSGLGKSRIEMFLDGRVLMLDHEPEHVLRCQRHLSLFFFHSFLSDERILLTPCQMTWSVCTVRMPEFSYAIPLALSQVLTLMT